jgi:hypothetical protein
MPLAEFTKVVGVPGSSVGVGVGVGVGDCDGNDIGVGDCEFSLQLTKINVDANKRLREKPSM